MASFLGGWGDALEGPFVYTFDAFKNLLTNPGKLTLGDLPAFGAPFTLGLSSVAGYDIKKRSLAAVGYQLGTAGVIVGGVAAGSALFSGSGAALAAAPAAAGLNVAATPPAAAISEASLSSTGLITGLAPATTSGEAAAAFGPGTTAAQYATPSVVAGLPDSASAGVLATLKAWGSATGSFLEKSLALAGGGAALQRLLHPGQSVAPGGASGGGVVARDIPVSAGGGGYSSAGPTPAAALAAASPALIIAGGAGALVGIYLLWRWLRR